MVRDGDGHFYNVKSPGVAALSTPLYMGMTELNGWNISQQAALNARETKYPRWQPRAYPPLTNYGYSRTRGVRVEHQVESEAPMIWALTLLVAVIPGVLLLFGVRWAADKLEPGYGTAAAITLGHRVDRDDLRLRVLLAHHLRRPRLRRVPLTDAGEGRIAEHPVVAAARGDGRPRRDLRVPDRPGGTRPLQHLHHTASDLADLTRHARAERDHVTTVDGHRFTITQVERVEGAVARQQHHANAGGMDQEATLTTERGS